jgi:hypothetical protein
LCRSFEKKAIHNDRFFYLSVCLSAQKGMASYYFFIKLLNSVAFDNTVMVMPNSLGLGHILWSYAPLFW